MYLHDELFLSVLTRQLLGEVLFPNLFGLLDDSFVEPRLSALVATKEID